MKIRGEVIALAKGKEAEADAWAAFHKLMAEGGPPPKDGPDRPLGVLEGVGLFLDHAERTTAKSTYAWYRMFLASFVRAVDPDSATRSL